MSNQATTVKLGNLTLELRQGNIALLDVDAIVNAANEHLSFGSGVAGAILAIGGDSIQKECHEIGFCKTGSAVMTSGGNLVARHVIHAVGPMYGEGNEKAKLGEAVTAALRIAEDRGLHSIALPAISAGLFHYPVEECASVMIDTIKHSAPTLKNVNHVIVCLSDDRKLGIFTQALQS